MEVENVSQVAFELQSEFPDLVMKTFTYADLFFALSNRLKSMINEDFSGLLQILYRIDISESKLRDLISTQLDKPASDVIAHLIIERQLQKVESRKMFKASNDIPEDEKW
ncbi:MAG TPA: hypothetical protein VF622_09705 [Segetibacter sp.]|jgi:hypothetical protein